MNIKIISDVHLGSSKGPRYYQAQLLNFRAALEDKSRVPVMILGDLFDRFDAPYQAVWDAYNLLRQQEDLILVAGNHDLARDTTKLSAFDFLCQMLVADMGDFCQVVKDKPRYIDSHCVVVPHLQNQEIFDKAIADVNERCCLFFHANFENSFTKESDHSLNLSAEQARRFKHCFGGHEHNKREVGNVTMLGAVFPCSISEAASPKFYHIFRTENAELFTLPAPFSPTYSEQDWQDLSKTADFVRVTGTASQTQAAEVIQTVASFRSGSDAFAVTNSVQVDGVSFDATEVIDDVETFNPLEELRKALPAEFHKRLEAALI
jgi:DNA repair exonuclease SbcCD nuclease subunit